MKKPLKLLISFCPLLFILYAAFLPFFAGGYSIRALPLLCFLNIALIIIGSLLTGFLSIGKEGKKGMFLALAAVVAGTVFWIVAFTFDNSPCAYIATALSSYFLIFASVFLSTHLEYTLLFRIYSFK